MLRTVHVCKLNFKVECTISNMTHNNMCSNTNKLMIGTCMLLCELLDLVMVFISHPPSSPIQPCPHVCVQALSHCERITDSGIRHLVDGACSETLQVLELDNCPFITDYALDLLR